MMETTEKRRNKKRRGGFLNYLMGGRFLVSDIFTKNALLLGLIVLYSFIYVSNRYEHEQELLKINRLNKRRNEIRNNVLILKSDFAYRCRLSEIEKVLIEKGSEFAPSSTPPFIIDK